MSNKNHKPDSFLKDGLSIDESRISVLILSYMISFLATTIFCIYLKDIESLKAVFFANIASITGINVTNTVVNKNNKSQYSQQPSTVMPPPPPDDSDGDWPKG